MATARARLDEFFYLLDEFHRGYISKEDIRASIELVVRYGVGKRIDRLNQLKEMAHLFLINYNGQVLTLIDELGEGDPIDINDRLYSCSEIANILNVSRATINNWEFKNILYRGKKKMIPEKSLKEYISGKAKYENAWKKFKNT